MSATNPPAVLSREWWLLKLKACDQCAPFAPLLIAAIIFGVAAISAWLYPPYIRQKGDPHEWVQPLLPEMTNSVAFTMTNLPPEQKSRLEEQARFVAGRASLQLVWGQR